MELPRDIGNVIMPYQPNILSQEILKRWLVMYDKDIYKQEWMIKHLADTIP